MLQCADLAPLPLFLPLQSYGTPGREAGTPCTACSTQATGFSFEWMMNQDTYQSRAVAIEGAASAGECLSEFAQTVDGAWYIEMGPLPGMSQLTAFDTQSPANPVNTNTSANTHAECMSQCVGNCMFATVSTCPPRLFVWVGAPFLCWGHHTVPPRTHL